MLFLIFIGLILYTFILIQFILKKSIPYVYYRDLPSNDTPAYVGKVFKQHVDGNDIVATILDLSYRGYISITTEKINGKTKRILHIEKHTTNINLEEHELFLINQIFKNGNDVIFDDYIKSKKFKHDFTAFDKMLDRKVSRNSINKNSSLRNINKIIFLTVFILFGFFIFYSLLLPVTLLILKSFLLNTNLLILINSGISVIIFIIIAFSYISYINKSTSAQENINLKITYIALLLIIGIALIFYKLDNITMLFHLEMSWYSIVINFVISIIVTLYMFNIIKHNRKSDFLLYLFAVLGIICIICNLKIALCLVIIFISNYIFFKSPKHTFLQDNDYIYKWESFKKYLEDYSLLNIQEENAILIWEKYLIYAIVLGINKNIIKHYAKLNNTILIDENYLKHFYIEYLN